MASIVHTCQDNCVWCTESEYALELDMWARSIRRLTETTITNGLSRGSLKDMEG